MGFGIWVSRFRFGGFRRLSCWISRITVEIVVVVGRIGEGSICDLWVQFVICGCGFVGDVVLVPWWWLCCIFFYW